MRFAFIVNPASGHGRTARKRSRLEAAIRKAALDASIHYTTHPRHATALVHELAPQADAIIAVGGDGTVQEVIAGLASCPTPPCFGVIPSGTGNDFVKMLAMPSTLEAAVSSLAKATPTSFDYGLVRWLDNEQWKERVFANALGIGFDAQTAIASKRYKMFPGLMGYLLAVLQTLVSWQHPSMQLFTPDHQGKEVSFFEGAFFLTTAANGRSTGGGFYLTPDASITDGLLDLCVIAEASKARVLRLLPQALLGKRLDEPEIHRHQIRHLRLKTNEPLPIHADGEVLSKGTYQLTVHVVSNQLSVLLPPPASRT